MSRVKEELAPQDYKAVDIRPLEWLPHHAAGQPRCPDEYADTLFGMTYVASNEGWWRPLGTLDPCAGILEAKAAAQADYESRIRDCLVFAGEEEL